MRALVTGAAGFIGSTLTERLLAEGWDVVALDSFTDYYPRWIKQRNLDGALASPACRLVETDLAVDDLAPVMDGVDTVFHLAARAGVRTSWGTSFDQYLHDNLLATQRLLEAAKTSSVSKIVYASSSSIYGDAEAYPTPETTRPLPISPYGMTKLAGENLAYLYHRKFGVPTVSLRFFTVYGPRQRPDMAFHIFCRALLEGQPINIFGDGEQSREFTFVHDVVRAIIAAGDKGTPGEVYNVGGGGEVTVNEAIQILREVSGKGTEVRYGESMAGDARRTVADTSKAREGLGFVPETGLREGLEAEYRYVEELLRVSATK